MHNINTATKIKIDISYCDGCGKCALICPAHVFEIRELTKSEHRQLTLYQKFWVTLKGKKKSFVLLQENCIICRKCEKECHEKAIKVIAEKRNVLRSVTERF